jgi:ribosomal protein L24
VGDGEAVNIAANLHPPPLQVKVGDGEAVNIAANLHPSTLQLICVFLSQMN